MVILKIAFWIVVIYLLLGVLTTVILSQTPYSANAWWHTTVFWPWYIIAFMR